LEKRREKEESLKMELLSLGHKEDCFLPQAKLEKLICEKISA
jgi:hypothetical protein